MPDQVPAPDLESGAPALPGTDAPKAHDRPDPVTEPADHLIERAAALLRTAAVVGVPDGAERPPGHTAPRGAGTPALALPSLSPLPGGQPVLTVPGLPPPGLSAPEPAAAARLPAIALETMERAGMVVARAKRTRISEEYRIVIGRVLRTLHEERPPGDTGPVARNTMLITSARPGEGKSFTALNLAGSIAQNAGEQVLLVDVDPKLRPMSQQLGLGERKGFLDLVAQPGLSPDGLILPTALPNLSVLPLGTRPAGQMAAPLADGSALRPITPAIHMLAQRYPRTLIILDAPPCLSTSDSHTIAGHVGQVVMVVEAERTQRSEVEAALDLVRVCPSITMLLNKARLTTSYTFGAYDYFGSYT